MRSAGLPNSHVAFIESMWRSTRRIPMEWSTGPTSPQTSSLSSCPRTLRSTRGSDAVRDVAKVEVVRRQSGPRMLASVTLRSDVPRGEGSRK